MSCGEPVNGQECYNRGFADGAASVASKLAESASSASTNTSIMQLLCDVKGLLLNNDTPPREARVEIVCAINEVLAQLRNCTIDKPLPCDFCDGLRADVDLHYCKNCGRKLD